MLYWKKHYNEWFLHSVKCENYSFYICIYQSSDFLERENMRKKQNGTTRKAAALSKSSFSFDITPILDQSPLYLNQHKVNLKLSVKVTKRTCMQKISYLLGMICIYPASMNPNEKTAIADCARNLLETLSGKLGSWVLEFSDKSLFLANATVLNLLWSFSNREEALLPQMMAFSTISILLLV